MGVQTKVLNAALAGLLHDIGKLEQRARVDPWNPAPGIDREGQPVHATWTMYFVQNYIPKEYQAAALAGAYHHAPEHFPGKDQALSELVALADKLSAGERADQLEEGAKLPKQMVTIFDRITLGDLTKQEGWHYLPLAPLKLEDKVVFPVGEWDSNDQGEAYERLRLRVEGAAREDEGDEQTYLENLLSSLQQITWCVPSAYYHSIPDVSLYDHSRMTAALAVCLTEFEASQVSDLLAAVKREFWGQAEAGDEVLLATPVALLIGGDISGVQDFIYTISSKNAARTLRGRSFYLQLLTEAVLRFVLDQLGLPYSNVIYSGGGHFFLLAPVSAAGSLLEIQKTVTKKLLKHHGAGLYLAMGRAEVPASGFKIGQFPKFWRSMHQDLAQAKAQRYTELGNELYPLVFEVPEFGGNPRGTCAVCGEDQRKVRDLDKDDPEESKICDLCQSFVDDIGKPMPGAYYVALGIGPAKASQPAGAGPALREFGLQFQFVKSAASDVSFTDASRTILWALDDPGDEGWPKSGSLPAVRWLKYTVNRVPVTLSGELLTFDHLREHAKGIKRLGVLRMDVDDLGEVFKSGLGESATLARLSTLSFQISLYFEGWVKHLCESGKYENLIYAVYAGGDDLFLIGPWDRMPYLAQKIRDEFRRYTAGHPALHVSGGMAFIGGKYPVYQAAADAKEAEEQAKEIPGKDAFSFLDQPWKWETFQKVAGKREQLHKLVGEKDKDSNEERLGGPRAIIQVLRRLALDEAEGAKDRGRPVWGPWMWHGPYLLTRMMDRYKRPNPELAGEIESLRDSLDQDNYGEIDQWGAAARWEQLLLRKGRDE